MSGCLCKKAETLLAWNYVDSEMSSLKATDIWAVCKGHCRNRFGNLIKYSFSLRRDG